MKGIVWIASYPKSGNTWFRAFLTNLRTGSEHSADINHLDIKNFADRSLYDETLGWETSDLTDDVTCRLRMVVQETLGNEEDRFFKTHEAFTDPTTGEKLFSLRATRAAIYIVRNPLDVAVSYSNHQGETVDSTIRRMNKLASQRSGSQMRPGLNMPETLGSWSWNVTSWADAPGLRSMIMRYEDMLEFPLAKFAASARFLGFPHDDRAIARAVGNSSFAELRKQERARRFVEAPAQCAAFFKHGRAGVWRDVLTASQIAAIVDSHRDVMRRFGYLKIDGSPAP